MIVWPGLRRSVSAVRRIFNSASFDAPLTHSLALNRGTGSATLTRATTKTFSDHEGVLRTAIAGEAAFTGARRVRNLLVTTTADLSDASWTKVNMSVTTGHADPDGGTTACKLVEASGAGIYPQVYQIGNCVSGNKTLLWAVAKAGERNWFVINNNQGSGGGSIRTWFDLTNGVIGTDNSGAATIDSLGDGWYLCCVPATISNGSDCFHFYQVSNQDNGGTYTGDGSSGLYIWHPQLEDITGRADQTTPSEYVSVGVLSAPYHGAGVDGVEYFDTDLDGNALTTLDGISIHAAATQYLGVTGTPATQTTASLGTGTYTLWVEGSGSALASGGTATLSGAASATEGSHNTFSVTGAGTVTVTVTGSLTIFQLEKSPYPSPYIANTGAAGTSVTRNLDRESTPTASNVAAAASSVYLEYTPDHAPSGTVFLWATYVDASNYTAILHDGTNLIMRKRIAASNYDATIANAFTAGTTYKAVGTWGAGGVTITLNGTEGTPHANTTAAQIGSTMETGGDGNGASQPGMSFKNVRITQRQYSASERLAVTQ